MSFFGLLDRLIHPATRAGASVERLRQLRLIAGLAAGMLAQSVGFTVSTLTDGGPAVVASALITAGQLWVLGRLRFSGSTRGSGPVLWGSVLAIMVFAGVHEGSLAAFSSPGLAFLILVAIFLDGTKTGFVALVLAMAGIAIVAAVHASGHALPALRQGDQTVGNAIGAVLGLAGFFYLTWLQHGLREQAYVTVAEALDRAERAETELRLSQKLEAVGRLAGGVAHEINTPLQVIASNTQFLNESYDDLSRLLGHYQRLEEAARAGSVPPELLRALDAEKLRSDLDFALSEVPAALNRSREGVAKVSAIIRSMQAFAWSDSRRPVEIDLNQAVRNTLELAQSQYQGSDLELSLGALPKVRCVPAELNQVMLSLVSNAGRAIADKPRAVGVRGALKVTTWAEPGYAVVSVADDGVGIEPSIQSRIFDPFFTTRAVGSGMGQGLALAHAVVVQAHKGTLTFVSAPGVGSTFYVRLPVETATLLVA